jgi:protocatechuate 3,4-dioxygenase beta subunit
MSGAWRLFAGLTSGCLLIGCSGTAAPASIPSPSTTSVAAATPTVQTAAGQAQPTPISCSGRASPAQTEGPYFKAGSPARTSLIDAGVSGTRLALTGYVLTLDCKPVSGAVLDFWQADASGTYDNSGFKFRGHQSTDAAGRYALETVMPGLYPGRTEHIHVKVEAPGQPPLTTQLYFPGVARNQQDSIFSQDLLVSLADAADGKAATYNFVLNLH